MASHIELTRRAFAVLESLPQKTAFGLFRLIDALSRSPAMGSPMEIYFPGHTGFRQLIYKRTLRVIYKYDSSEKVVHILTILDCRQQIPDRKSLESDDPEIESPLE